MGVLVYMCACMCVHMCLCGYKKKQMSRQTCTFPWLLLNSSYQFLTFYSLSIAVVASHVQTKPPGLLVRNLCDFVFCFVLLYEILENLEGYRANWWPTCTLPGELASDQLAASSNLVLFILVILMQKHIYIYIYI